MQIWRAVPGYEQYYQVSNTGKVKSLRTSKIMSPGKDRRGNLALYLYHPEHKKKLRIKVSQIVALTFIGPRPRDKHMVLHRDDDKGNNHVLNLYYGNNSDNQKDAYRNGRVSPLKNKEIHARAMATQKLSKKMPCAEQHYKARLTWEDVNTIRTRHSNGESCICLGKEYKCTDANIHRIVTFKNWRVPIYANASISSSTWSEKKAIS